MTRCAQTKQLTYHRSENVDRSRPVVARLNLKSNAWMSKTEQAEQHKEREQREEREQHMHHLPHPAPSPCRMEEYACRTQPGRSQTPPRPPPMYDVFLGGSCGNTVWRRQLVIPHLKKRSISYYDPQRSVWSENMIYEENIAKENSSLFLFVLDPATINATSFLEIAYYAAMRTPKLVVVFLGRSEWSGKAHPADENDRLRTCQLLDRILDAHNVPLLTSIPAALTYIEECVIGCKRWRDALSVPSQRLAYLGMRTRGVWRAAGRGAKGVWNKVQKVATRTVMAGATDAAVLVACQIGLPHIPLYMIIVPLVIINVAIVAVATVISKWRKSFPPVRVGDCNPVVPQIALATMTTPLNSTIQPRRVDPVRSQERLREVVEHRRDLYNPLRRVSRTTPLERPVDVYLGCSCADQLDWITNKAAPTLQRHSISFSTELSETVGETRMRLMQKRTHKGRQVLYHIPNTKTFLSGMVEEAEQLEAIGEEDEVERAARRRRNDSYAIACCYLQDIAKRKQCRVFSDLDDAVSHVVKASKAE